MFINGEWKTAESGREFAVYNPASGDTIGLVPDGNQDDALLAVKSARDAFPSWSATTAYQRSDFLYRLHSLMMENQDHLAAVMTEEQGKPIQAARNEVRYGADFLLWFAEEAKRVYGRTIPSARSDQRFLASNSP